MSIELDNVTKTYLQRLIVSIVPAEFGDDYITGLYETLISHLSEGRATNNSAELNRYKLKFLNNGLRNEWANFNNIVQQLAALKTKEQMSSYLVFVNELNGGKPTQQSPVLQARYRPNSVLSDARHDRNDHSQSRSSSFISTSQPYSFLNKHDGPLSEVITPYYKSYPEEEILKYLSFTLLGSDTQLFSFNNHNETLTLPDGINNSYVGLLHKLLEPALIYKNLVIFIETTKGKLKSPIKNAYLGALNTELTEYSNHINRLFNNRPSSLLVVYKEIHDRILNLRFLYHLSVNKFQLIGYEFLSEVFKYSQYGDLNIQNVSSRIFQTIVDPYYEMVENWLINGDLVDMDEEFFIYFNLEKKDLSIIEYKSEKVPQFFPQEICHKIYQIGKLIIYLKNYCHELNFLNNYFNKYNTILYQDHNGLKSLPNLKKIIDLQYKELVNYTNHIIYHKLCLINHIKNYQNFLFMKKVDFIDSIIYNGNEVFSEPSNSLNSYQLTKILQDSLNQSSIKYLEQDYSRKLDARILDLSHGNLGWQVFTLEYKIDKPLEVILNHDSKKLIEYLKIFNFLWKLKKIEFLLTSSWKTSHKLVKTDLIKLRFQIKKSLKSSIQTYSNDYYYNQLNWLISSSKKLSLIRNEFNKFLLVISNHLNYDVIEYNSNYFLKKTAGGQSQNSRESERNILLPLNNIGNKSEELAFNYDLLCDFENPNNMNLDDLMKLHSQYLDSIVNYKLLRNHSSGNSNISGKSYIEQIYNFLEIFNSFVESFNEFNTLIVEFIAIMNIKRNEPSPDLDNDEDLSELNLHLKLIKDKISQEIYQSFRYSFKVFIRDMKNDLDLRDLSKLF